MPTWQKPSTISAKTKHDQRRKKREGAAELDNADAEQLCAFRRAQLCTSDLILQDAVALICLFSVAGMVAGSRFSGGTATAIAYIPSDWSAGRFCFPLPMC